MTLLHQLGEILRDSLALIPLPVVRTLFVGSLIVVMVWVIRLPDSVTCRPDGEGRLSQNLKPAAVFALAIQILVYLLL